MPAFHVVIASEAAGTLAAQVLCGAAIAGLVAAFLVWFYRPARSGNRDLRKSIQAIRSYKDERRAAGTTDWIAPHDLDQFIEAPLLKQAWDEFRDTVYEVKGDVTPELGLHDVSTDGDSISVVDTSAAPTTYRQAFPASDYFTHSALVDDPLHTEFFKHLPGILTGVGIIGTFFGVIVGIGAFNPSAASPSVAPLLNAVQGAFWVSGVAIFFAIVITLVEKGLVNSRTGLATDLCTLIDSIFPAQSGDQYLQEISTLAKIQTRQLRQLFLLGEGLEKLGSKLDTLDETVASHTRTSNTVIKDALEDELKDLVDAVIGTMKEGFGEQAIALQTSSSNLLESTTKLESMAHRAEVAGTSMSESLDAAAEVIGRISDATTVSSAALENAKILAEEIARSGEALAVTLEVTEEALSAAKSDAEGSKALADGLAVAAVRLETFTQSLGDQLVDAQQRFSAAASQSLSEQSREFDARLAAAATQIASSVSQLNEAFVELSETVEEIQQALPELPHDTSGDDVHPDAIPSVNDDEDHS